MADRPILFSAPMVRALLDGRKTQTRRLCKWANNPFSPALSYIVACDEPGWFGDEEGEIQFNSGYAPGDRLWVKERFTVQQVNRHTSMDGRHVRTCIDFDAGPAGYEARQWVATLEPDTPKILQAVKERRDGTRPLVPGIFLPRIASRLTLTVTDVRVQRLQECSEEDAEAEGCVWDSADGYDVWYVPGAKMPRDGATARECYGLLWNSINGAGSWESNPWIVAVSFDVRKGNIDG